MLPSRYSRISCSLGSGFSLEQRRRAHHHARGAEAALQPVMRPGTPPGSTPSDPSALAMPSMVRTSAPSSVGARRRCRPSPPAPSTCTTQAPHWPVSQPTCVPVSPRPWRRNSTSSVRPSTVAGHGAAVHGHRYRRHAIPSHRVRRSGFAPCGDESRRALLTANTGAETARKPSDSSSRCPSQDPRAGASSARPQRSAARQRVRRAAACGRRTPRPDARGRSIRARAAASGRGRSGPRTSACRAWLAKHSHQQSRSWRRRRRPIAGTKTFGEPRPPSHFGISYSRIRWSRKVFQASSDTTRWSWCRSCP